MIKRYCDGKLRMPGIYGDSCYNSGTIIRGKKAFCWSHDPEGQAKRDAAQDKKKPYHNQKRQHEQGRREVKSR